MLIEGSVFSLHKRVLPTQKMAACQIVIVLLLGFYLQFCHCSRQIRAAAEQQNITEDHRLLQDSYTPPVGSANHDEMAGEAQSFTRLADEMVEKKPTSELPLSGKHKRLNMKLKGREDPDSFIINTSSKFQEPEKVRKNLFKSRESSSRGRSFLSSSQPAEESMNSTVVSSSPENQYSAGGGIMDMDYSPVERRPPIHNKVSWP